MTFHVGDDRILVDGQEQVRTQTIIRAQQKEPPLAVTVATPARPPAPAAERASAVLAARSLTKSYGRRTVVAARGPRDPHRRGGGPAGAQRGRQDHDLLHGGRPRPARQRPGAPGGARHHRAAHVSARARRHRVPAPGGERLPQAHRGGERARHPGDARACPRRAAERARAGSSRSWASWPWRSSPPTRCRAASAGGWRSAARCTSPSFILLDEPFAGIDPLAVHDIQEIIGHLTTRGIGILITDHNVRETLKITDRAYILSEGEVFRSGTPGELASDEEVRRVYLGENHSSSTRAGPRAPEGVEPSPWRSNRSWVFRSVSPSGSSSPPRSSRPSSCSPSPPSSWRRCWSRR